MNFENEEKLSFFPQCVLEKYYDDVIAGGQIGHTKNFNNNEISE